jgi:hypothetical protein
MAASSHARAFAFLGGLVGGCVAFGGISAIVWGCASIWGRSLLSRDPAAADSFGWSVVISLPVVFASTLGISVAVGVLTHNRIRSR